MKREVLASDLKKLYTANDMAKLGCRDCLGCCDCCQGMGVSVVLDPMDIHRLSQGLSENFAGLMRQYVELNVADGILLPNLRMAGEQERCVFLNSGGRCRIHAHRPGFCRMFPLGRYYQNGSFLYFLQEQECRMQPKTKVKISKWLDTPDLKQYERFVTDWHNFLEGAQELLATENDEQLARDFNMYLLENFYVKPYGSQEFYGQFYKRLAQAEKLVKVLSQGGV